jgi:hypothetical protein
MIKRELDELETAVMKEVVKRRGLGGYSTEAEGLLMDGEFLLKLVRHMNEQMSRKK